MLPLRVQLRAYPPPPGADLVAPDAASSDLVVELEVGGGHRVVASMLRVASWVAPDDELGRERLPAGSLYRFRQEPGGTLRFLGVSGNRFLFGDSRERLVALLARAPAPIVLPAGLEGVREAVALPGEDVVGWWADPAGGGRL